MGLWLTLIIIGIILAVLGFSGIASWLIYVGIALLVIGVIVSLVRRAA